VYHYYRPRYPTLPPQLQPNLFGLLFGWLDECSVGRCSDGWHELEIFIFYFRSPRCDVVVVFFFFCFLVVVVVVVVVILYYRYVI